MNQFDDLVLRKTRSIFGENSTEALTILAACPDAGQAASQARIQLAVLKLSEGKLESLRTYLNASLRDWRDVLAWAEYPEELRAGAPLGSPERQSIQQRDKEQYLAWLSSPADDS